MTDPLEPYKPPMAGPEAAAPAVGAVAVPDTVVTLLAQTRPWVKLLSVMVFVMLGLSILAIVGVGLASRARAQSADTAMAFLPLALVLALYIPPALFLWRYADSIRQLQAGGGHVFLEAALRHQKSFWKYMGVFVLVGLVAYGLIVGIAVLTGSFGSR